jgi:hypothetical protein
LTSSVRNGRQFRAEDERPTVGLVVTVHEPGGRLLELAGVQLPALVARYASTTAFCSGSTHPAMLDLLRKQGVRVVVDDQPAAGIHQIGVVRRKTLGAGLQAGTSHLHLCDFDRALHWVAHHPDELDEVVAEIPAYDMVVLGRTARAWATHPPYQADTEPLFNKVFALASGLAWDVGAGSRGLSRRASETLLVLSEEQTVGIDAEWPLLLVTQDRFQVRYRACDGLEFETADRFGPEIEAAGGYEAWEAQMSADPARWAFRLKVTLLIAEAATRYGRYSADD